MAAEVPSAAPPWDRRREGAAYDPNAPQGSDGIDRVELFLDSRDGGGTFLGSATPASDHTSNIKIDIPGRVPLAEAPDPSLSW